MVNRLISLSVGTKDTEDYVRTFQDISELGRNLAETHAYISVTASIIDSDDTEDLEPTECKFEHLAHDEMTMLKVREALMDAAAPYGHGEFYVKDLIHAMQNAGILFRERR